MADLVKITAALPEHLRGISGREGLEEVTKDDLIIPRLMISQALSPQLSKSKPQFIEGLGQGELFNSVTGETYGQEVEVIVLRKAQSRIMFRPLKEGGGIVCQSFNGINGGRINPASCAECPNSQWGDDEPPKCTEFKNFPAITVSDNNLIALSFKSTAIKAAKQLITRMSMFNKPAYAAVWTVKVIEATSSKGTYFQPVVTFKRWTTAAEYHFAADQFAALKGRTIKTDEAGLEEQDHEDVPF